jgi:hypothetical protein
MNILIKALDTIKYSIPNEILRIAFKDDIINMRQAPTSLDEQIMSKVIRPRILVDSNLVGGQMIIVSLQGVPPKYVDTYTIIFEIPLELIMYRNIISVLSIGYLPYVSSYNSLGSGMGTVNPNSMNDVMSAAQRVGDSVSNIPPISNATVELIGANTILVRDQLRVTNAYQLRCIVANEENLNNISPRSYQAFSKLCLLAVKSYIYNKLIIAIDMAYLTGGQELGQVKSYVEGLSDAEENYQTYLAEVMAKVFFMNDTQSYARFIRTQISPGL